jgi:hypothetical protein
MKWLLIGGGIVLAAVAALVIVLTILVEEELKQVQADPEDFAAVELGQTQAEVEAIMGDTDHNFELVGAGEEPEGASCLFYLNRDDNGVGYRLCYADGELVDKKDFDLDDD